MKIAPSELTPALLAKVARGARIVIERGGKPVAALVSIDDLHALESMDDRADIAAARAALAESDRRIPYETIRRELGLAKAASNSTKRRG